MLVTKTLANVSPKEEIYNIILVHLRHTRTTIGTQEKMLEKNIPHSHYSELLIL
jgi:hypothetical protein